MRKPDPFTLLLVLGWNPHEQHKEGVTAPPSAATPVPAMR